MDHELTEKYKMATIGTDVHVSRRKRNAHVASRVGDPGSGNSIRHRHRHSPSPFLFLTVAGLKPSGGRPPRFGAGESGGTGARPRRRPEEPCRLVSGAGSTWLRLRDGEGDEAM
ncbi:hypothetical protein E2562_020523 [Oryza meyeriana var. granulata]|uniref:Uncharacterized protein n=1 Tax=Oryza meyeriana var. granulata TaxID=110450 RepID=A0A6G1EBS7_9ORYZ|nr:hypothetical protein E2562_020523 [Oryza meyeriana var. granulata]